MIVRYFRKQTKKQPRANITRGVGLFFLFRAPTHTNTHVVRLCVVSECHEVLLVVSGQTISMAVYVSNQRQELEYRLMLGEQCGTIRLFGVPRRLSCDITSGVLVGRSTKVVHDF